METLSGVLKHAELVSPRGIGEREVREIEGRKPALTSKTPE